METSDFDRSEFDPKIALQVLLEITQEQSLDKLLRRLVDRIFESAYIARVYVWLIEKGDICATCVQRPECPDQTRCLHMVAGGRRPVSSDGDAGVEYLTGTDHLARVPLGVGVTGKIVLIGHQIVLNNLDKDPGELRSLEWLKAEKIRGFHGGPIIYNGQVVGIITVFTRSNVPDEAKVRGDIYSNHIGGVIANARAFEELRVAGQRLEQANQRLERELAERKEAEEKLRQSEQRYRRIVDTASEGIWELDEHFVTTLVNHRMAIMLGYQPQEMVGRKLHEFLFADDQAEMSARIAARRQGLTERYEQKYSHKDGSPAWMHVSATSVRDAEHRFLGSFAMLTDITERKRAEEALRRLNRELRAISNCNQVLLHATDEQSLLKEICRIVCQEAGYRVAWVGYAEHDEAKSVRPVAWTGTEEGNLTSLGITWADTERGRGPTGTAIRTGENFPALRIT